MVLDATIRTIVIDTVGNNHNLRYEVFERLRIVDRCS